MKTFSEIKTADEAVAEAIKYLPQPRDAIGFLCLWECHRLGLLPIEGEPCFGTVVTKYIDSLANSQ